jgi:ribonuclease HII
VTKKQKREAQPGLPMVVVDEDPAVVLRRSLRKEFPHAFVAGLDEAGRGPLAGPVVAAACVLPDKLPRALLGLNDSKALTEEQRETLFPIIQEHALVFDVAVVEAPRIDEINILRASLEGMRIAFEKCSERIPLLGALIDGNQKAPLPAKVRQKTVIGGDARCRMIMAASILAKVTRDRRMKEEHTRFPDYGFDEHKGYGTPQHLVALKKHGPCELHRRSFAPVREALGIAPLAPDLLAIEGAPDLVEHADG